MDGVRGFMVTAVPAALEMIGDVVGGETGMDNGGRKTGGRRLGGCWQNERRWERLYINAGLSKLSCVGLLTGVCASCHVSPNQQTSLQLSHRSSMVDLRFSVESEAAPQ